MNYLVNRIEKIMNEGVLSETKLNSDCDHEYSKTFILRTKFQKKYFSNEYKENFERDNNNI
jgi:hypothetical protein